MRLSVTSRRPGSVGQPPRQPAGHYGECLNWANALEQPPASLRGGLRQGPQASAWGLAARRGAVWAEGLADGAPRARSGHHQAASCGLRRCRELRISPTQSRNRPVRKETPAKGRLRVRVRSRSHPGRGVLTSAQRLRVRSPSRPALPLASECSVSYVHHRVAVYGALPSTLTAEWQCEVHCHSLPSVPVALPLGPDRTDTVRSIPSGSEERTATRP